MDGPAREDVLQSVVEKARPLRKRVTQGKRSLNADQPVGLRRLDERLHLIDAIVVHDDIGVDE